MLIAQFNHRSFMYFRESPKAKNSQKHLTKLAKTDKIYYVCKWDQTVRFVTDFPSKKKGIINHEPDQSRKDREERNAH